MSSHYIPKPVRHSVAKAANYRCGYCLTPQSIVGPLLEIDHIIPEALGGTADEDNLWLACPTCNGAKSDRIQAIDPESGENVSFFNPRLDSWTEHFIWLNEGAVIAGLTPKGRATVTALNMNHPDIVAARQLWVTVGWHPPADTI